jgi:hypothetical protein
VKGANAKRLAEGIQKTAKNAGSNTRGKGASRTRAGRDAGGAIGETRSVPPLVRLIQSLGQEKIRFQIVGMTAAVLQGVSVTTFDTDIWVDLPERQYIRLANLLIKQKATAMAPTLYVLEDGKLINFLFSVTGLRSFSSEYKGARTAVLGGEKVKVLPLDRILKSKKTILRDKDMVHIPLIEKVMAGKKFK